MKIVSKSMDKRINAHNYLVVIPIKEYLDISKKIINKNEYQRKRVKKSNTIYSLLKTDLRKGCIIPPIVLAIPCRDIEQIDDSWIEQEIMKANLLILDGLQRTYTLIDLEKELIEDGDSEALQNLYKQELRIEVYVGINKLGILYRMLTLNTGQTPVSLRHQIEILYLDYSIKEIDGIILFKETDETNPEKIGEYKFDDVVEGFNSYLEKDELPIDRIDILENIKGLEKLSKEDQSIDLFKEYLTSYNDFLSKLDSFSPGWNFDKEESNLTSMPFGDSVLKIFCKSQPMTGFGAAIGKLTDLKSIDNFENLKILINKIQTPTNFSDTMTNLLKKMDEIKNTSKRIGPSQREFFHFFFRELFNKDGDSFLNIDLSIERGYRKYVSQS